MEVEQTVAVAANGVEDDAETELSEGEIRDDDDEEEEKENSDEEKPLEIRPQQQEEKQKRSRDEKKRKKEKKHKKHKKRERSEDDDRPFDLRQRLNRMPCRDNMRGGRNLGGGGGGNNRSMFRGGRGGARGGGFGNFRNRGGNFNGTRERRPSFNRARSPQRGSREEQEKRVERSPPRPTPLLSRLYAATSKQAAPTARSDKRSRSRTSESPRKTPPKKPKDVDEPKTPELPSRKFSFKLKDKMSISKDSPIVEKTPEKSPTPFRSTTPAKTPPPAVVIAAPKVEEKKPISTSAGKTTKPDITESRKSNSSKKSSSCERKESQKSQTKANVKRKLSPQVDAEKAKSGDKRKTETSKRDSRRRSVEKSKGDMKVNERKSESTKDEGNSKSSEKNRKIDDKRKTVDNKNVKRDEKPKKEEKSQVQEKSKRDKSLEKEKCDEKLKKDEKPRHENNSRQQGKLKQDQGPETKSDFLVKMVDGSVQSVPNAFVKVTNTWPPLSFSENSKFRADLDLKQPEIVPKSSNKKEKLDEPPKTPKKEKLPTPPEPKTPKTPPPAEILPEQPVKRKSKSPPETKKNVSEHTDTKIKVAKNKKPTAIVKPSFYSEFDDEEEIALAAASAGASKSDREKRVSLEKNFEPQTPPRPAKNSDVKKISQEMPPNSTSSGEVPKNGPEKLEKFREKMKHFQMLKAIESNMESLMEPVSDLEKLAMAGKPLDPAFIANIIAESPRKSPHTPSKESVKALPVAIHAEESAVEQIPLPEQNVVHAAPPTDLETVYETFVTHTLGLEPAPVVEEPPKPLVITPIKVAIRKPAMLQSPAAMKIAAKLQGEEFLVKTLEVPPSPVPPPKENVLQIPLPEIPMTPTRPVKQLRTPSPPTVKAEKDAVVPPQLYSMTPPRKSSPVVEEKALPPPTVDSGTMTPPPPPQQKVEEAPPPPVDQTSPVEISSTTDPEQTGAVVVVATVGKTAKRKKSRSLSSSTASSTDGSGTDGSHSSSSSSDASSESSSSSSESSSSSSESDEESDNGQEEEPKDDEPKNEQESERGGTPELRRAPIKFKIDLGEIQLNLPKIAFEDEEDDDDAGEVQKSKKVTKEKRLTPPLPTAEPKESEENDKKPVKVESKSSKDSSTRNRRTESRRRDDKRHRRSNYRRSHSRDRSSRFTRSRTPPRRSRSRSKTPLRKRRSTPPNRRRRSPSPRRRRRSPHTPDRSPRRRSPRRPPSPKDRLSDTESPVVGFKRSVADSTISDAELENQQISFLNRIQGYPSAGPGGAYGGPMHAGMANGESGDGSPQRVSLDERINAALGIENQPKYSYQPPDAGYSDYYRLPPPPSHAHYQPYRYEWPPQQQQQHQQQYDAHQFPYPPPAYGGHAPRHHYQHAFNPSPVRYPSSAPMASAPRKPFMTTFTSNLKELPHAVPTQHTGNLVEIVPSLELPPPPPPPTENSAESTKKFVISQEEIQARAEKKAEMKKKRKADREKKRLEKRMRKEKLKLEIKRLISMGVKDEDASSEEEGPFDDITKKGMFGTKDQGILRPSNAKPRKKSVRFSDGIVPGDGSSPSHDEETLSPKTVLERKKLKKLQRKRTKKGLKAKLPQLSLPPATEQTVDPELEAMPPPLPPDGAPPQTLQQPRFLHADRVPPIFFRLQHPQQHQQQQQQQHYPSGHSPYTSHNMTTPHSQSPASSIGTPQQQQQSQQLPNKFTPNSRITQPPPTFGAKV